MHEWQKEELRHWRRRIRMKKVPQIAQWQVPRRKKLKTSPNLPSLLPLLTDFWSWLKWVRYVQLILKARTKIITFSSEQLKLVAWLDLASQDQVTAASRWTPPPTHSPVQNFLTKTTSTSSSRFYRSSKPVHPKHGHLVPTPGDWWDHPHELWSGIWSLLLQVTSTSSTSC